MRLILIQSNNECDPHPNGLSSVWVHPSGGQVLEVHRWDRLDPGARAYSWLYPLHIGELGGVGHTVLNALLGLAVVGFAGSGLWLWWQRRRQPDRALFLRHEPGR